MKNFIISFLMAASLTFLVNVIVIYFYNLSAKGEGMFDLKTSLTLAIVFGVVLPLTDRWRIGKRS